MISSRRLAREWALKVLYQMDVGKVSLTEALEGALERLRNEFVQKGSRSASGSRMEEISLDFTTAELQDTLACMRPAFERALAATASRILMEAPYWIETRLERFWRPQAPGVPLIPPRLLTPLSDDELLPDAVRLPAPQRDLPGALSEQEAARCRALLAHGRRSLPTALEAELKVLARTFARATAPGRPTAAGPAAVNDYVLTARMAFNADQAQRWSRIGEVVQKQTADWLRTAAFTVKLVEGIQERRADIDREVADLSSGWSLERQVSVDRNILRMAAYEILYLPAIPASASINEAIELAKKFSTAESGRFVNGVLGALLARGVRPSPRPDEADEIEQDTPLDLPDISDLEDDNTEETKEL